MSKKLRNLSVILIVVSIISLIYPFLQNYIIYSLKSNNKLLIRTANLVSGFGKVSLPIRFLDLGKLEFNDSKILNLLKVNLFSIIISLITIIGAFQFLVTKGKAGKKSIKFALVIISISCFTSIFYFCYYVFKILTA